MRPVLTPVRLAALILGCLALLVAVALVSLFIGSANASSGQAWAALWDPSRRAGNPAYEIILQQRLPRVVLGALVGFGLGLAGAAFQAILRNPLADPYTLGVASGSAVGASAALALRISFAIGPFGSVQAAALVGGGLVTALIYRLGVVRREFRVDALLLGGVTVALVSSSAIVVMRTLSDPYYLVSLDRWLMGGLAAVGVRDIVSLLPFWLAGCLTLLQLAGPYNQLGLGEELAYGRGVDPQSVQKWTFVAGSLLTAALVSAAGPIGFVGLIVPHAMRRLIGPDHRALLPCAGLASGAFLIACDTIARTVVAPSEMPVGVVTAVIGGPVFVWILLRRL